MASSSLTGVRQQCLDLRSRVEAADRTIIELTKEWVLNPPARPPAGAATATALQRQVDVLQQVLARKERATQTLRLQAGHANLHELKLEEHVRRKWSVKHQREIASRGAPKQSRRHTELIASHAELSAEHLKRAEQFRLADADAHEKWSALVAPLATLTPLLDRLGLSVEALLERERREREADAAADAATQDDAAALEREVEEARDELQRLRQGSEDAAARDEQATEAEQAAARAALGALHKQTSSLRATQAQLQAQVAAFQKAARQSKACECA